MDINEAYEKVLAEISGLEMDGLEISINKSISASNEKTIDKFKDNTERLSHNKWIHVGIKCEESFHIDKVFDAERRLSKQGIYFDTGFGGKVRDWEIDWSLNFK